MVNFKTHFEIKGFSRAIFLYYNLSKHFSKFQITQSHNSVSLFLSKTGETGTTGSKTGSRKQQKKIVDAAEKVKRGYFDKGMAKMRMLFG